MKILLTGIAGFIGFHLCQKLLKENYTIIGLDNINDYYDPALKYDRLKELGIGQKIENNILMKSRTNPALQFIKADLCDKESLDRLCKNEKFDIIIHLAAQAGVRYSLDHPYAYLHSNLEGFLNILEASRHNKIKHLLYASSSSVYGLNKTIPFHENDNVDHPASLYAATKKSNELLAHSYSYLYKLPVTGLRFFTVYGPWGRPDMAYFIFTRKILAGEKIDVYNFGNMQRDFTYIDDITEGISRLIPRIPDKLPETMNEKLRNTGIPYNLYNIGNNKPVLLNDFIGVIEKLLNKKAEKNLLPIQPGDVEITYADIDKLKIASGFQPTTEIEEGMERFIKWYRNYYNTD